MVAPPDSDNAGDDNPQRAPSFTEWLRRRDDRALVTLLRLRPDLALPAPADVAALAGRCGIRTSTQRAVDLLDAPTLQALESVVIAADADDVLEQPALDVEPLRDRALVWDDGEQIRLAPAVREALGPYPAGLGRPAALLFRLAPDLLLAPVLRTLGLPAAGQPRAGALLADTLGDPARVADLVAATDPVEREILERLSVGPPVGVVRGELSVESDDIAPARRLVARGLLVPIDSQRVELPREVGLILRTSAEPGTATAPDVPLVARTPEELDSLGTSGVSDALRLVDALAEEWSARPPALLRAGGVGVRDLRRTARELAVPESTVALIAEVAYAAGLLNSTNGPEPAFLATPDYDEWRAREPAVRWVAIASAWLAMTRQPGLVGERGERDRMITVLGPDAERGTIGTLRRQVLELLAGLPPGAAPQDRAGVLALLTWHQPRRAGAQRRTVETLLGEADLLGVTAAGGVTGYTRTLLAGSSTAAADALRHALPDPVDHFLVQPDLTVVVPGPPERELGTELGLLADLESTGGASVYRITERTVRRALDAGRSGAQLRAFVTEHSRTPIPQSLGYLIDDAARRHGVLRTGTATAYLRCDDEALLTRVLTDRGLATLDLQRIAPTVVVTRARVSEVLDVLREAGYAPAAEAADGTLVTIGDNVARAPNRPPVRPVATRSASGSDTQLVELVRRIRAGEAASERHRRVQTMVGAVPGVTSAAIMELLRTAVREGSTVWLGVAEPDGSAAVHEVQPISLAAGFVRGYERGIAGLASYPVHRVTAVRVVDEVDDPDERDPVR